MAGTIKLKLYSRPPEKLANLQTLVFLTMH